MEVGENLKFKEKLKNWLFADEIKELQKLKNDYDWLENITRTSLVFLNDAKDKHKESHELLDNCRKLLNQICDIGVNVGFHTEEHSWAVVCIAGKPEYVKFLPLNHYDARDVLRFLKQFEYSKRIVDSPIAFKSMLKNRFLER